MTRQPMTPLDHKLWSVSDRLMDHLYDALRDLDLEEKPNEYLPAVNKWFGMDVADQFEEWMKEDS